MSHEADTDHHPKQIVRPLGFGEFAPAYSTEELLRGVCHIARVYKPKKELKPSNLLTEGCKQRFNQHFGTISAMMSANKSNVEIGEAIHLSHTTVSKYINMSLELMALSRKRNYVRPSIANLSQERAEETSKRDRDNFDLVARMLIANRNNTEIGEAIGFGRYSVTRRIRRDAVLKQLAAIRVDRKRDKNDGK